MSRKTFAAVAAMAALTAAVHGGELAVPSGKLLLNRADAPWNSGNSTALREEAEAALRLEPVSVTDKELAPPSGDKRDYMSFGPYWWPDPSKPDGLPYIRRDGEHNPGADRNSDRPRLARMMQTVATLAAARYRFADGKDGLGKLAGETAVRWLKHFFLDPETGMNPNLDYGQAIPGICDGRGIGIIESADMAEFLLDAIILLHESGDLSDDDFSALQKWFGKYLDWLGTSKNGLKECGEHNNHGTAYDVQSAAFGLFCGRREEAASALERLKVRRIDTQIMPDGSQPHELARTRALSYSTKNAALFANALVLGEKTGVDLWGYESADGRSIRKCLEWMIPYWRGDLEWKWPQITQFDKQRVRWPLAVYRRFTRDEPVLLFAGRNLAQIRQRMRGNADAKAWWDDFHARMEAKLAAKVDVPERGGQWYHWYTCRRCGTHLETKSPVRHVCPSCGEEHTGWPYDDVAVRDVHNGLSEDVRDFAVAYALSGDGRFLARAREILAGYAEKYPGYELHNKMGKVGHENVSKERGGRVGCQVLTECSWLVPVLQGYDIVRNALTAKEREKFEANVVRPAVKVCRSEPMKIHNHECWHIAAWGLGAIILGDERMLNEAIDGEWGLLAQYRKGMLADGMWFEGAPGYQFYALRALAAIESALVNGGRPLDVEYVTMLKGPMGMVSPGWSLPALNDSARVSFAPGIYADLYELGYAFSGDDALGRWLAAAPRRSMTHALCGRALADGIERHLPKFESVCYEASGVAVLRSWSWQRHEPGAMPDNYLAVDFGPHGGWHGHYDKLNIVLWGRGELLAEDPGCIGYGNPRQFGWYKTSLAHNTLVIDGRNQRTAEGKLLAFAKGENGASVSLDAGEIAKGVEVRRSITLDGDVVVDVMTARSKADHDYEWAFHSRGDFSSALGEGEKVELPQPTVKFAGGRPQNTDGIDAWSWTENVRSVAHPGRWSASWTKGNVRLRIIQRVVGADTKEELPGELRTAEGSAQPPSEKLRIASCRVRGKNVAFCTLMIISSADNPEPKVEISDGKAVVGGRTILLPKVVGNEE